MKLHFAILMAAITALSTAVSAFAESMPARVAVVALSSNDAVQTVSDLAEARLADDSDFVLVERREIDRILSEQQLSLGLLCDPDQALRMGELLKADLLVLSDSVPGLCGALGIVVFETAHGRRLWDEVLPAAGPDRQAEQVWDRTCQALRKGKSEEGITACIVGVRNADLPRARNEMGESMAQLIERRLTCTPNVMLLERSHLDLWRREQELAFTAGVLRTSAVLIDLEISRGNQDGQIRCAAYLSNGDGSVLHKPSTEGSPNVADLADQLWTEICRALNVSGGGMTVDRRVEAAQFAQEADRLSAHGDWEKAFSRATAAYALDPENTMIRSSLIVHLAKRAERLAGNDPVGALGYADQSLDLSVRTNTGSPEKLFPADVVILQILDRHKTAFLALPETRDRCLNLQRKYLAYHDIGEGSSTNSSGWREREIASCSATSGDYVRNVGVQVRQWLANYDRLGVEWDYGVQRMYALWLKPCGTFWGSSKEPFARDDEFYRGMNDLCVDMVKARDPLIQSLGKLGILIHDAELRKLSGAEIVQRWEEFRSQVEPYIAEWKKAEQNKDKRWRRSEAYWLLLDAADLVQDVDQRFALIQRVFDLSMSNRDVIFLVDEVATTDFISDWRNIATYEHEGRRPLSDNLHTQILANVECVLAALDDPTFDHPDPWGWQRDKERYRHRLLDYRRRWLPDEGAAGLRKILSWRDIQGAARFDSVVVAHGSLYMAVSLRSLEVNPVTRVMGFHGIRLLRLNSDGGEKQSLGDMPVFECHGIEMMEAGVFVATEDGLWQCASDGSAPRRRGADQLPSKVINSIAAVGDNLFMGMGNGSEGMHFVRYNVRSGEVEVIASSERRQRKTPFDSIQPGAFVRRIYPDLKRNRLVLVVDRGRDSNNSFDYQPLIGLWAFDLTSNVFHPIVTCYRSMWAGEESNGRFLFSPWSANPWQPGKNYRPWYGVIEFDLATDTCEILCSHQGLPAGSSLAASASTVRSDVKYQPPFLQQYGILFVKAQGSLQWMRPSDGALRVFSKLNPVQLASMDDGRSFLVLTEQDLWKGDCAVLAEDGRK